MSRLLRSRKRSREGHREERGRPFRKERKRGGVIVGPRGGHGISPAFPQKGGRGFEEVSAQWVGRGGGSQWRIRVEDDTIEATKKGFCSCRLQCEETERVRRKYKDKREDGWVIRNQRRSSWRKAARVQRTLQRAKEERHGHPPHLEGGGGGGGAELNLRRVPLC